MEVRGRKVFGKLKEKVKRKERKAERKGRNE